MRMARLLLQARSRSGGQITLLPGQYAQLSYSLTADGTGIGGQSSLEPLLQPVACYYQPNEWCYCNAN